MRSDTRLLFSRLRADKFTCPFALALKRLDQRAKELVNEKEELSKQARAQSSIAERIQAQIDAVMKVCARVQPPFGNVTFNL